MEKLDIKGEELIIKIKQDFKDDLYEILDHKGKILKINPKINTLLSKSDLLKQEKKTILRNVLELTQFDCLLQKNNIFYLIKYDRNKLNKRFAGYGEEKDVDILIEILFKGLYHPLQIYYDVNKELNIKHLAKVDIEYILNGGYRKILYKSYKKIIERKLKEHLNSFDCKIVDTIAGKILRDNFDKHLKSICENIYKEIQENLLKQKQDIIKNSIEQVISFLDFFEEKNYKNTAHIIGNVFIEAVGNNINKLVLNNYYQININETEIINKLSLLLLDKKDVFNFKKEVAKYIIGTIQENLNNRKILLNIENFLNYYNGNIEVKKGKRIVYPKIRLKENFKNVGKGITHSVLSIETKIQRLSSKSKTYLEDKKNLNKTLSELIICITNVIGQKYKIINLSK